MSKLNTISSFLLCLFLMAFSVALSANDNPDIDTQLLEKEISQSNFEAQIAYCTQLYEQKIYKEAIPVLEAYFAYFERDNYIPDEQRRVAELLANVYMDNGDYKSAIDFSLKYLGKFNDRVPNLEAQIYYNIGKAYLHLGNYEYAYEYLLRALFVYEQSGDQHWQLKTEYYIATAFYYQENYQLALSHYEETYQLAVELKDSTKVYNSLSAKGSSYAGLGEYEKALELHENAYELAKEINYQTGIMYGMATLGSTSYELAKYDQALTYLKEAVVLMNQSNDRWGEASALIMMGKVYLEQKKLALAEKNVKKALSISWSIGARQLVLDSYEVLARTYQGQRQFKQSASFFEQYISLKDSLLNETSLQKMSDSQKRYEVQMRDLELATKDAEIESIYRRGLIGVIIALLGVFWLIYSKYRSQYKNNVLLAEKNKRIKEQNEQMANTNQLLKNKNEHIEMQNRRLELSNNELKRFAYIASHDLKEPLRTVGSYASLIKRRYASKLDETGLEFLTFITSGISKMYTLLNDVMDYSRLENGEFPIESVDVGSLVNEICGSLQTQISEKNAVVNITEMPTVFVNRNHLGQIFQNLISNSIKYNQSPEPHVFVSAREENDRHVFSVRDNGIGIDMNYSQKIFEAFKRLHRRDEYEGSGVGLAICKKIVSTYGGDIWVDSAPNVGSTFYFSISKTDNKNSTPVAAPIAATQIVGA